MEEARGHESGVKPSIGRIFGHGYYCQNCEVITSMITIMLCVFFLQLLGDYWNYLAINAILMIIVTMPLSPKVGSARSC